MISFFHPRSSGAWPGDPSFKRESPWMPHQVRHDTSFLRHPWASEARPGDSSFNEHHHGCRIECGMTSRHHRLPITHYLQLQPHYLSFLAGERCSNRESSISGREKNSQVDSLTLRQLQIDRPALHVHFQNFHLGAIADLQSFFSAFTDQRIGRFIIFVVIVR